MPVSICFFGDSMVNGTGDDACLGWVGRICAAARRSGRDLTCYNLGVRRDTTADVLARWQREAEAWLPSEHDGRLVFSFGANDCCPGEDIGGVRVAPGRALANAGKGLIFRLLGALLIFYIVLFSMQRYLLFPAYMADRTLGKLESPGEYGLTDFAEVHFNAENGVPIMGWSHPSQKNMPYILYLHGNGMHIAGHIQRYQAFAEAGYGVFRAFLAWLWQERGIAEREGILS
jgi:hypothetical protein